MKLEIWEAVEIQKEEPIRLAFMIAHDGVIVTAVNGEGETLPQGKLVTFRFDGTISRYPHVSHEFGFELDSVNRIRLHGDDCGDC